MLSPVCNINFVCKSTVTYLIVFWIATEVCVDLLIR